MLGRMIALSCRFFARLLATGIFCLTLFPLASPAREAWAKKISKQFISAQDTVCLNCSLDSMVVKIRQRLASYPSDTGLVYRVFDSGNDSLIEIIAYTPGGFLEYRHFRNGRLVLQYTVTGAGEMHYQLILFQEKEREKQKWIVLPGELHQYFYDQEGRMERYWASIVKGKHLKIEYQKEWNPMEGSFISGQTESFERDENGQWQWMSTKEIGVNDWP